MRAFWNDWRKAGKPPLPWRESLRTARATPKKPQRPASVGKPVVLSAEDIAFARRVGMKLPKLS
jgi:hypothetical protein